MITTYKGRENAITAEHLKNGEECVVVGFGQSITPRLKSGQPVRVIPITDDVEPIYDGGEIKMNDYEESLNGKDEYQLF